MAPVRTPLVRRWQRRAACLAVLATAACLPAFAHHGWAWAEGENSELTGTVVGTKLGNPHGEVTLDVNGVHWIVEVGQPWRNARAGLKDEMLAKGTRLTAQGHRHADADRKVLKAERIVIDGKTYPLYPGRD